MAHDVFHHHDRRVHQHADGNREATEAHQVGAHADEVHEDEREKSRERKRGCHHHGRAHVAEKEQEQHHDQDDRLGEGFRHGADRALHQVAAVVEDLHLHARGQPRRQLGKFFPHAFHDLLRVRAA